MKRVLIVDDFAESRTLVKTVLQHPDRQILEAPDGVEALKVLAEHDIDLVLTDGQMPRMDGLELMQTASERFPSVRFIVVSGSPVTPELRAMGPLRIFSKPFGAVSLKETVDNVLGNGKVSPAAEEEGDQETDEFPSGVAAERLLARTTRELRQAREEVEQTRAQLIHSEKMTSLGQLAAGVAHEVNNPIGFIMCNLGSLAEYAEAILEVLGSYRELEALVRESGDSAYSEALDRIGRVSEKGDVEYVLTDLAPLIDECREGTRRVKDIVHGLKSFARQDAAEMEEIDLNAGLEETLKLTWNMLKYKCAVKKELAADLPKVRCHPGQLYQVVMNLLINAAEAIPKRGEVRISSRLEEGSMVAVEVADTGEGITPENLDKLFTPFFTTKPMGKGTGLGLAIARRIVEDHKGTLTVESEVGKGSVFTVRLPVGASS